MCTGHENIVRTLIKNGASINARGLHGDTALISSLVGGNHRKVGDFSLNVLNSKELFHLF